MPRGKMPDKHGDCPHCKSPKYKVIQFSRGIVWHCPRCRFTSIEPISDNYYLALRRAWSNYCVSGGRKVE